MTKQIDWWTLEVYDSDNANLGTLLDIVTDQPELLADVVLDSAGAIGSWHNYFIAAPGEEHSWDTPRCPVDWTGFREELEKATPPHLPTDKLVADAGGHDYIRLYERPDGSQYVESNGVYVEEDDDRFDDVVAELEAN